MKKKLY